MTTTFRSPASQAPLVAFALLFCLASVRADPVDEIVQAEMKRQHTPGMSIAVVKAGRPIKVQGYGLANVELGVKASANTYFQTGSVGKQFAAALVMLLAEDGKVTLDAPVSSYLPDTPPEWQKMTVRHLLTHTSGLDHTDKAIDLRKDYTEAELLASAYKVPLLSAPGEKWSYSNLGYQVLGILCSRVGGKFYGDQLQDRLFVPGHMQARIISERDIVLNRSAGYDRIDGELKNQEWVAPSLNTTADGSLYVTARDMARWAVVLDGKAVLSQSVKDAMWTPASLNDGEKTDYGFGWKIFSEAGRRSVRHRGDWQGFTAHILHFPEDRLTISVLMNRSNEQPHVIADKIAAHYIPALRKPPAAPPTAATLRETPLYLIGTMNDWKPEDPLLMEEPGVFSAQLRLDAAMHGFKIVSADRKSVDFGATFDEALATPGTPKRLEFEGEDLWVEIGKPGTYSFRLDARNPRSPTLTLTPVASPAP